MFTLLFSLFIIGYVLIHLGIVWFEHIKNKQKNKKEGTSKAQADILSRNHRNPILSPKKDQGMEHDWQSEAVFNPAAIQDDAGKTHILYRAIGSDGISRLGYDSSEDGISFIGHTPYPVFTMKSPRHNDPAHVERFDPVMYPSGGSWGGCEDPRMVRLDGRIYVTFTVFDSWDFIRIACMSIAEEDFFARRWKWSRPLLISPDKEINKNWVLFPQKFKGKFAILHRISPDIQIDYVDRLEDLAQSKQIIRSKGGKSIARKSWDTWVRGAGPPPILTDRGWLVIYHAINEKEPDRYKLGALLLDKDNPKKVLARSEEALLGPDMWYENDSKPGVVYACGAAIRDGMLHVYYGGGDKHVCIASAPIQKIFDTLKKVGA